MEMTGNDANLCSFDLIMLCEVICNSVIGNLEYVFQSNAVSGD